MTPETLYVNQARSLNRGSPVLLSVTPSRNVAIQVAWGSLSISGVKAPWASSLTSSSNRYCTSNVVSQKSDCVLTMLPLLEAECFCLSPCSRGFLPALPRNVFYEDRAMLVVILCTVRQSFPFQLLFQCWDPYDILHWTFHTDTFCHNKHTQGKLPGHTKFWYPCRDWLGWTCSSEDPCTSGLWQVYYSSGLSGGSHLHPPSPLPLGSPGGCSSM